MSERTRKMDPVSNDSERRPSHARAEVDRRTEPIFKVVSKAATDLNDVLNAVALRSALMRGRSAGSYSDSDTWRLAGLLDRASELVRELQSYVHEVESEALTDETQIEDHPGRRH